MDNNYTQEQAIQKNKDEYTSQADLYAHWQATNVTMQKINFYTTFQEIRKEGVEGKTFLEVGCGQCPIGQRLVQEGAAKIYGLDISEGQIEEAKKELEAKGILDKFEFICADIFLEKPIMEDKVDCVVLCYVMVAFVNSQDTLNKLISQCKQYLKEDGYILVTDVAWCPNQTLSEYNILGYWMSSRNGTREVGDYELYDYHITEEFDKGRFEIYNITPQHNFIAAINAGFHSIEHIGQYPDPEFKDDPSVVHLFGPIGIPDYTFKFKLNPGLN